MKVMFIVVALGAASLMQVPTLDLTSPPSGSLDDLRRGGSSPVSALPLRVALTGVQDQPYRIHDDFEYEVEISNPTATPVAMAWSNEQVGPAQGRVMAMVVLVLSRAGAFDKVMVGAFAFGNRDIPGSMLSLQPGAVARIRAGGSWQVPMVTDLGEELLQTNGRYQLRAQLSLNDFKEVTRTELSEPVSITLMQRP